MVGYLVVIALDFQSINPLGKFRRPKGSVRGTDFLTKPSKVLDLTTSWVETVSLKGSFCVRVLLKRESRYFH